MKPHFEFFLSRHHEMGRDRLMRIPCICNYLEEAAGVHASALGVGLEDLNEESLSWVLVKMRLQLRRRPGPGERITVETWPVGVERLQFRRDFILYDDERRTLGTAVSQWVVMGLETRRVERFPLRVTGLVPDNPRLAQETGDIRIPAVQNGRLGPAFPVRLADIDQNQHVNNCRYVDFALESAELAGMGDNPRQIDMLFRAEGLRGDVIHSVSAEEQNAPGTLVHSFFRKEDDRELARIRTVHD